MGKCQLGVWFLRDRYCDRATGPGASRCSGRQPLGISSNFADRQTAPHPANAPARAIKIIRTVQGLAEQVLGIASASADFVAKSQVAIRVDPISGAVLVLQASGHRFNASGLGPALRCSSHRQYSRSAYYAAARAIPPFHAATKSSGRAAQVSDFQRYQSRSSAAVLTKRAHVTHQVALFPLRLR